MFLWKTMTETERYTENSSKKWQTEQKRANLFSIICMAWKGREFVYKEKFVYKISFVFREPVIKERNTIIINK